MCGRVYVYGVIAAGEAPDLDISGVGEDSTNLSTVAHEGVAAVISPVEDDTLLAARDVRAHWRVLEELAKLTTVIPVKFGTVMEGEDAVVSDFLRPQAARLTELLEDLRGKVQLSLKAFYEEDRLLSEVVEKSPDIARLRQQVKDKPAAAAYYERIQLGELVSAEVDRRRADDAALLLQRLEPLAVEAKSEPVGAADMAANLAFLVEESRVDELNEAVGRLTEELGERLRIRYVGPMPPYSFADTEAEEPAWA